MVIGILHMGKMGSSLAAELKKKGHTVITSTVNRSEETKRRTRELLIADLPSEEDVFHMADMVISICSGGGYMAIAQKAKDTWFPGFYIEANSMPAQDADTIRQLLINVCSYVDAGIYGYPIPEPEGFTTERTIYAQGFGSQVLRSLLEGTAFNVEVTWGPGKVAKEERHQREAASRTQ